MPSPTPLPSNRKLTAKELRQLAETQNRQSAPAPTAANTPGGQNNTTSATQPSATNQPATASTPAPQTNTAGAQQAKELLSMNRPSADGFGTQQPSGTQSGSPATEARPASPVAAPAKPGDLAPVEAKAPEVRPSDGSSAPGKPPVNTVPVPGSPATASGKLTATDNTPISAQNPLTQKLLGSGADTTTSGAKSTAAKTVTRTVIGPNGEPMTVTERKVETPKPVTSAIPSTFTYYARSEEPRPSATRTSSNSANGSSASDSSEGSNKASGTSADTENKDNKVVISNEEALKIQGELGSNELTTTDVLSYANNLEDQLAQLQRQGTGNLSQDDFASAQSDLKDKLTLAQSLYTRIKGTQLRILQNDPASESLSPASLAGPALFGGAEPTGFVG